MTTVTINGHIVENPSTQLVILVISLILVIIVLYVLPSFWNFYNLFEKAKQPGWAVVVPVYAWIIAARIGKKPTWLAVLAGIVSLIQYNSTEPTAYYIQWILTVLVIALNLPLLVGLSKQYKAARSFWYLLVLFPPAATFQLKSVKYRPRKV